MDYCSVCSSVCALTENRKLPSNLKLCKKCKKAYFYQVSRVATGLQLAQCKRDGKYCKTLLIFF